MNAIYATRSTVLDKDLYFIWESNACSCGLGELAAFLLRSAKKVTVYPSPASCTC